MYWLCVTDFSWFSHLRARAPHQHSSWLIVHCIMFLQWHRRIDSQGVFGPWKLTMQNHWCSICCDNVSRSETIYAPADGSSRRAYCADGRIAILLSRARIQQLRKVFVVVFVHLYYLDSGPIGLFKYFYIIFEGRISNTGGLSSI